MTFRTVATTATSPSDHRARSLLNWRLLQDGLVWRELDSDLLVFCGRSGATHRLADAEAWLFERLLRGAASTEQLIVDIREDAADESAPMAEATIASTLAAFEELGLVANDVAASDDMSGLSHIP
jgi:hypothetical protein